MKCLNKHFQQMFLIDFHWTIESQEFVYIYALISWNLEKLVDLFFTNYLYKSKNGEKTNGKQKSETFHGNTVSK